MLVSFSGNYIKSTQRPWIFLLRVKNSYGTASMLSKFGPVLTRPHKRESGASGPRRFTGRRGQLKMVSLPKCQQRKWLTFPKATLLPLCLSEFTTSPACSWIDQGVGLLMYAGVPPYSVLCFCSKVSSFTENTKTKAQPSTSPYSPTVGFVFLIHAGGKKAAPFQLQHLIFTHCTATAKEISR